MDEAITKVERSARPLPSGEGGTQTAAQRTNEEAPALAPSSRYRLIEEIARGGMGVIHRALDTVLGREVAVKVLQERFGPDSAVSRRFIDEARIAGQLQHPGIPVVHDMGTLSGGQPFLAMKLVKGRTLEDLLKERDASSPHFVAIFEQICQAVGYAHAHGVIHRDLKPSNVMVGAFAEVQVMDWGLAKVLGGETAARAGGDPAATSAQTQIHTERAESDGSLTQFGSVLGTPAYMSPEQAGGEIDKVDERSDVFGLGSILCVMLTGQPPYAGTDSDSVRLMAVRGQMADCLARLDRCEAEPGLVALCKRCLAFAPADRPRNAEEVAEAVAALRAEAEERARSLMLDQARAEAQARELRKRRRVQLALAAALLFIVGAGAGGKVWLDYRDAEQEKTSLAERAERENKALLERAEHEKNLLAERARKQSQVEAAVADAFGARAAGDWADAMAQVKRAQTLLEELPPNDELAGRIKELRQAIADEQADRKFLVDLDRASLAATAGSGLQGKGKSTFNLDLSVQAYHQAFADFGLIVDTTDPAAAALRIRSRPRHVQEEILSALIQWKIHGQHELVKDSSVDWVQQVIAALDLDTWTAPLRSINQEKDVEKRRALCRQFAETVDVAKTPARVLPYLALDLKRAAGDDAGLRLVLRAQNQYPNDFWINTLLASSQFHNSLTPGQVLTFASLAAAARPTSGTARHNLYAAFAQQERWDQAALTNQFFSDRALLQGYLYERAGRLAEAEAMYRLELTNHPGHVYCITSLGLLLRRLQEPEEAAPLLKRAAKANPEIHDALMRTDELLQQGNFNEAQAEFLKKALAGGLAGQAAHQHLMRLKSVATQLDKALAGKFQPREPGQMLLLATVCRAHGHHLAAVRFTEQAFAAEPGQWTGHRYDAACCAVLALSGKDAEQPAPDAAEAKRLSDLARKWLRADLVLLTGQAHDARNHAAVRRLLTRWQRDPDLSTVRNAAKLSMLPAADQMSWETLWADVATLLGRVSQVKG